MNESFTFGCKINCFVLIEVTIVVDLAASIYCISNNNAVNVTDSHGLGRQGHSRDWFRDEAVGTAVWASVERHLLEGEPEILTGGEAVWPSGKTLGW